VIALPPRISERTVGPVLGGSVITGLSLAYLSSVFQIWQRRFWTAGLGDWVDPYFINALLEHWFQSATRLSDPSSPPMFFPATGTLGYSHGLVLYALAYLPFRLVVHPFQAYSLALMAVMEIGVVCLYLLLRRWFRLRVIEAVLLSAFFLTSPNVLDGAVGVWSQRASVFLIPPILLSLVVSSQSPQRWALAFLSGLSASLLFIQDFYTAQFALLFAALFFAASAVEARRSLTERWRMFWGAQGGRARAALVVAAIAAAWTGYVWRYGGGALTILGVRVASHDWRRPALVALVGLVAFIGFEGGDRRRAWVAAARPWLVSVATGAAVGLVTFLWMYAPAYREHASFPEEQLMNALSLRDPARWDSLLDVVNDLDAYESRRPFTLVFVAGILAWLPRVSADRKARLHNLLFVLVSLVVLLMPLRFDGFSLWRLLFAPLPGFESIRDPRRIIYVYELALVLGIAGVLSRAHAKSVYRIGVAVCLLLLLAVDRNHVVFDYQRPNEAHDRWVAAPIAIDRSCSSFFIKRASAEYSSRSGHKWTLYSIDALLIALDRAIPTLNGYSAWAPMDWELYDPEEEVYAKRVRRWIADRGLPGVCVLDIDARTMKPYRPS
jgi:hypothetical protein